MLVCRLGGSYEYCQIGRGICCAACGCREGCEKACLNSPARCGQAMHTPTPVWDMPQRGGEDHAGTETTD